MSGAENFIRAVLDAAPRSGLTVAVGSVTVVAATATKPLTAYVRGVADELIQVTQESWGSPFVASVAAGVTDGTLVFLAFNRGQAVILCTMGV